MKIRRFEDLECWKLAREFVKYIYKLTRKLKFSKDLRLVGQITNASVSIMNNIAEGWASQSNPELMRFLKYSRRSCAECQNCLYVALDQEYITEDEFSAGYDMASRVTQVIDGLLRYLRSYGNKQRGMQVKDILSEYYGSSDSNEHQ
ncbi:MAG: four helix bundle protein [candidate division WOR-3 bacterium]|nr:four helix bundle protein [candidate division WOR-3 bacterium]